MTRMALVVELFLSSPGDVSPEREYILSQVREWNSINSKHRKIIFDVLTWEDRVASDLAESGQDIINRQIGDEFDVYIGVMWGRLGSPTKTSDSGTVEEFNRALERYRSGERIRLAMLFKGDDIPLERLDGLQFEKVKSFKTRYVEEGDFIMSFRESLSYGLV